MPHASPEPGIVRLEQIECLGSVGRILAAGGAGVCFWRERAAADYTRVTCDLTLAAARALVRLNPRMTFVYVSGAGSDSSVRGKTENALFALPFASVCAFRPGIIEPLHGVRSKTRAYRLFYTLAAPLFPLLRRLMPRSVLTTELMGEAMLEVARHGAPKKVLGAGDIRDVALHLDGARAHAV